MAMFERKDKPREGPTLLDRVLKSGAKRIAILGLHPMAGSRTVLAYLIRDVHDRKWPFALTTSPRVPFEHEGPDQAQPVTRVAVPEGAVIASACVWHGEGAAELQLVEKTQFSASRGPISIFRVRQGGEVDIEGPGEPESMTAV